MAGRPAGTAVRKAAEKGQVSAPAQDKFPTERVLAARYHVSRQTVRSALKLLEEKGIIKKCREAAPT